MTTVEVINNKISGLDWYLRMHPIALHDLYNNFYRLPLKFVFTLSMRLNTTSYKEEIEIHLSINIGDQIYTRCIQILISYTNLKIPIQLFFVHFLTHLKEWNRLIFYGLYLMGSLLTSLAMSKWPQARLTLEDHRMTSWGPQRVPWGLLRVKALQSWAHTWKIIWNATIELP